VLLGFLAALIHSIDGGIMRMIIMDMYENHNYIISHLHDSIRSYPNQYNNLLNSIKKVYKSEKLNNMFEKNVFTPLKLNLLPQFHSKFDALLKKFKDDFFNQITISSGTFVPENTYPFRIKGKKYNKTFYIFANIQKF
jgi:hypothetical protein